MFQVGNRTLYPHDNRYQAGKVCKTQDNAKNIKTHIAVFSIHLVNSKIRKECIFHTSLYVRTVKSINRHYNYILTL